MARSLALTLALAAAWTAATGCGDKPDPSMVCTTSSGEPVTYDTANDDKSGTIRTLMSDFGCPGCHNAGVQGRAGAPTGLNLDSYGAVVNNARDSLLSMHNGSMPPRAVVPSERLCRFDDWIRQGFPRE